MEFLTSGEKIKRLRTQLKMKQHDFESSNMTRAYFGMIESGRRNLTIEAANIVLSKLRNRAEDLSIELDIDINYLLRTKEKDAFLYCSKRLEEKPNLEELDELFNIAKDYEFNEIKAKILNCKGDYFSALNQYNNAFTYYNDSIYIYIYLKKQEMLGHLYIRIALCKYSQLQYGEAIVYCDKAYFYAQQHNQEVIVKKAIYNLALCYKKDNQLDQAIVYIERYLQLCDKNEQLSQYIYANSLKANWYDEKGQTDNAISIYKSLLIDGSEESYKLNSYIYNNLASLYLKKNDIIVSLEYFNKAQKIRMKMEKDKLSHTLIDKSEVYIKQELYNEAILLIELGIENAQEYRDFEYVLKGHYLLRKVYLLIRDIKRLEETYIEIINMLETKDNMIELLKVYCDFQIFYLSENKYERAFEYAKKIQKKLESCCNSGL